MFRVLLVDDDKMVRKGLIATMPWSEYGFEIVGEANNGESALEFLKQHEVDVLITDLSMPNMNGIELMESVCKIYPGIWIVVLTFHQDFEWIQTSLRLGAIDYIAKVQLEYEQSEAVLERIRSRIRLEQSKRANAVPHVHDTFDRGNGDYVVVYALNETFNISPNDQDSMLIELKKGLWLKKDGDTEKDQQSIVDLLSLQSEQQAVILNLSGFRDYNIDELTGYLLNYLQHSFFYEYEKGKSVYEISGEKVEPAHDAWTGAKWENVMEHWRSLMWVVQEDYYENNMELITSCRPPSHKLESLFYNAKHEWLRIIGEDVFISLPSFRSLRYWCDWKEWIHGARTIMKRKIQKANYSEEISRSILQAVEYIHIDLKREVRIEDLARRVNMSRSYFSQCFKDIVGLATVDYLRKVRMLAAQKLLIQTTNPIHWIAQQCGYLDEKYFSRVFQEYTGTTPSRYRKEHPIGDNSPKKG
ncbi:response regulator transcription factor [Cohnella abietis]|uniref:DNA-binding response regulator n=1 Tax=Cohnella abietis TaxID=2507935 RepID=A0A3T1D3N8_9BACL|nr:response regulator [Cohnella abietis]BBI32732.1 hypothetical protein KCTCHS21_21310 [Cohnella abietis]